MKRTQIILAVFTFAVLGVASGVVGSSVTGKITAKGLRSNADALAYIEKIEGEVFAVPEPVVMDQAANVFSPRILPVLVGTTVEFLNSDPFAHSVFTPDGCADKFDLGSWPSGEKRSYTFEKPCAAVILCAVHPEMIAYVVAVETPYFAVSDAEGNFTIDNVPDGSYTLSVWHERLKQQSQEVTVSGATSVDFTLTR